MEECGGQLILSEEEARNRAAGKEQSLSIQREPWEEWVCMVTPPPPSPRATRLAPGEREHDGPALKQLFQ